MVLSAMKPLLLVLFASALATTYAAPPAPSAQGETSPPEDETFLEGDIVIDSEVIPLTEFRSVLMSRNLVANPQFLWPNKTVYYLLPRHGRRFGAAVEEALAHIVAVSCVRFAPRPPDQKTYLKLRVTGKGCATKVGYHEEDGVLDLHVGGAKCHTRGTIQHEFLHALGFWHEHTRPDRDKHVSIVWDNIQQDYKTNFLKRREEESLKVGLPYDYASVMHYKYTSFAINRGTPTIVPKKKDAVKVMGQRRGVTWVDIAKLNQLYNCSDAYYKGHGLDAEEAVFGKIVETGVEEKKFVDEDTHLILQDNENPQKIVSSLDKNHLRMVDRQTNEGLMEGQVRSISDLTFPSNLRNDNIFSKRSVRTDKDNQSHKYKREAGGAKSQTDGNNEMADQPPQNQNDGHENFAPQKILPELLKGVLNNDNNERPIVIQFAIYQPVIYRNENKTDNQEEGSTGENSNQFELPNKVLSEILNQSNERYKQNTAQSLNREVGGSSRNYNDPVRDQVKTDRNTQEYSNEHGRDNLSQDYNRSNNKFNTNSEEYNRDLNKYNRNPQRFTVGQDKVNGNSQEYARDYDSYNRNSQTLPTEQERLSFNNQEYRREQEKYNSNSQEYVKNSYTQPQHNREELDQRISGSDVGYHSDYRGTSSHENNSPTSSDGRGRVTIPDLMTSPDPSEIDRRASYDTRTEYRSSFQVSQKGGGVSKYPSDPVPSLTDPLKSTVSDQRLTHIQSTDNIPFQPTVTGSNQAKEVYQTSSSQKEFFQPPTLQQDRGEEISTENKTSLPQEAYTTRTEDIITPIPQIKYPVDTDHHVSVLKDAYFPSQQEAELNDFHTIKSQETKGDRLGVLISSANIAHDDYHLSESKPGYAGNTGSYNPSTHDLDSAVRFTDSNIGPTQISDQFVPNTFNKKPTKSPIEDKTELKVTKPLPAKSTEIPLDLEVGPPKMPQPLIGNGDGENVAPNWNGIIDDQTPMEESTAISITSSDSIDNFPNPIKTNSTDSKSSDGYNNSFVGTKIDIRQNRRPDIITEEDKNDELDKEIRRQKLEKKLREEAVSKRPETPIASVTVKAKVEPNSKSTIVPRRSHSITKVSPSQPTPTPPPSPSPKRPSNLRREVQLQEEDTEISEEDDDLFSKPNVSRVNLNPRQALPLNANATIKMNLRRLFRVERNR